MGREETLARLIRAHGLGFNTLLLAERGSGATSLLQRTAATLEEQGDLRTVAFVQPSGVSSELGFFTSIANALVPDEREFSGDPQADFLAALEQVGRAVLIVDGLPPAVSHEMFGRRRDDLWEFPEVTWIVSAHSEDEAVVLLPPADAFFEAVIRIPPMSHDEIKQMLRDRDALDQLGDSAEAVIRQSEGNPSTALRLAREAVDGTWSASTNAASSMPDIVSQIESELGRPAGRLAEELSRLGSSGPSDPRLLDQLGWSKPRAYQVFSDLERDGWVTASPERNGKPGRPRQIYRLKTTA